MSDYLIHWKYARKERGLNGKWRYYYDEITPSDSKQTPNTASNSASISTSGKMSSTASNASSRTMINNLKSTIVSEQAAAVKNVKATITTATISNAMRIIQSNFRSNNILLSKMGNAVGVGKTTLSSFVNSSHGATTMKSLPKAKRKQ